MRVVLSVYSEREIICCLSGASVDFFKKMV